VTLHNHKVIGDRELLTILGPSGQFIDRTKFVLDVMIALTSLLILAPILCITAVAMKIQSPGSLLSRKTLDLYENRKIEIFKFRTRSEGLTPSASWFDQWLDQTGVGELPQLINVLRGEISIVGRQGVPRWSLD
jgi:lipopolysaccharide/colanic/teichoic acid biosynthesis glycosyltransferase